MDPSFTGGGWGNRRTSSSVRRSACEEYTGSEAGRVIFDPHSWVQPTAREAGRVIFDPHSWVQSTAREAGLVRVLRPEHRSVFPFARGDGYYTRKAHARDGAGQAATCCTSAGASRHGGRFDGVRIRIPAWPRKSPHDTEDGPRCICMKRAECA